MAKSNAERWMPVVGYEGFYEVSDRGRVRSLDRMVPHAGYGKMHVKGGLLKVRIATGTGYPTVTLTRGDRGRRLAVHRLVLESFVGLCPEGCECRHMDGIKRHSVLSNLRWGTSVENEADKLLHGTRARGERNGHARVSAADVRSIRNRLASGEKGSHLAVEFGIAKETVSAIKTRRSWRHV